MQTKTAEAKMITPYIAVNVAKFIRSTSRPHFPPHRKKKNGNGNTSASPQNLSHNLNHKDWLSPNQVLEIFQSIQDPCSVIFLWNQYTARKDYKPNEAIYTIVINKLGQAKNFDAIDNIMGRIKHERRCRPLSDHFFYNVIKIYGNVGSRIKRAIDTLIDMPKAYRCWPSVKTFNLVLNMLVSAKLFDVVDEVYVRATMLGVEIDACCLNILIKGLCENGELEAALHVLEEFPKQRCRPNERTLSTLMHGFCKGGKVKEAFGLLERMEREGIYADTVTFNVLIMGLRKQGRVEEGMQLLETMKSKGCEPNEGSYQQVLHGLLDVGRFLDAKEFMSGMVKEGFNPSFASYKKLIDGLCNENKIRDVDWALKLMVKQGFIPKMGTWNHVLECVFYGKA
ncbi:hypothetical protein K2173_025494 [Erythroxylum novogranatense]|uniref:Pentatricopeptide repeat-containing protein n=1 Tax=Erythroxylum novogranatense TaxID=1862640 RepID=A0AAV8UHY1_9ROSI|nr:hypothetical protein K2173_025494 [Erythroxylum novogranatense]